MPKSIAKERRKAAARKKGTTFLVLLLVGMGLALSPIVYTNYRRAKLLLTGQPAVATLARVRSTGGQVHGHPELRLTVVRPGAPGERPRRVTVVRAVPTGERAAYVRGAEVDLLVDPNDPNEISVRGVHHRPGAHVNMPARSGPRRSVPASRRGKPPRAFPRTASGSEHG